MNRALLAGVWLAIVVLGSATVWTVIRAAGEHVTTQPAVPSGQSVVTTDSSPARPARRSSDDNPSRTGDSAEPSPDDHPGSSTSTAVPGPSATSGSSAPGTPTRSWQGSAGTVVTACSGSRIQLRSAQANPGWRVKVEDRGPQKVYVHFARGDDGGETEVEARCSAGEPRYQVSRDS